VKNVRVLLEQFSFCVRFLFIFKLSQNLSSLNSTALIGDYSLRSENPSPEKRQTSDKAANGILTLAASRVRQKRLYPVR